MKRTKNDLTSKELLAVKLQAEILSEASILENPAFPKNKIYTNAYNPLVEVGNLEELCFTDDVYLQKGEQ